MIWALEASESFGRLSCSECTPEKQRKLGCGKSQAGIVGERVFRSTSPHLLCGGKPGELRECPVGLVLREARQAGWEVEERVLWPAELAAADEMFVSNVRIGLWPVVRLDSRSLGVGERTRFLQRSIEALSD